MHKTDVSVSGYVVRIPLFVPDILLIDIVNREVIHLICSRWIHYIIVWDK